MRFALVILCLLTSVAAAEKHVPATVVVVIERSGKMQGTPFAMAKDAVRVAAEALAPGDQIAVVTADGALVIGPTPAKDRAKLVKELDKLKIQLGKPEPVAMLKQAKAALDGVTTKRKHVVLIGRSDFSITGVDDVVQNMRLAGITITTVGVAGADRNAYTHLAELGEGRVYMVEDAGLVPKVLVKELREVTK